VGPLLEPKVLMISYTRARREGAVLAGTIPTLDFRYGNVWTNIDESLFAQLEPRIGDRFRVKIARGDKPVLTLEVPYARTFADVPAGSPLLYLNSLLNVALALNTGSCARTHGIGKGAEWSIRLEKDAP
jgi:S-adenosylmethionine hydrolase